MNKRNYQHGVSLIEMMTAMLIVGILTSLALPSYRSFVVSNGILSQLNMLQSHLMLARSEAISRGLPVSVCRSTSGSACTSGSDGTNPGWGDGWIIFTDINGNGSLDAGTDTIIRVQQKLITAAGNGSITPNNLTTSTIADVLTFNSMGQNFAGMVRFDLKPPIANDNIKFYRYLCMANGGRVRVSNSSCTTS